MVEEKPTQAPEAPKEEPKVPAPVAPAPEGAAPPVEEEKKAPRRTRRKKPTEGETAVAPEGKPGDAVPVLAKIEFDFTYPPLFGKWEWTGLNVADLSLKNYINLDPIIVP